MPELPEVETIVRGLQKYIVGLEIEAVKINVAKLFKGDYKQLIGAKVKDVGRRGKMMLIRLDNHQTLAIHLKMTGQLIWVPPEQYQVSSIKYYGKNRNTKYDIPDTGLVGGHPDKAYNQELPHKHTHIIISFNNGSTLFYNDLRKFGWMQIIQTKDENVLTNHFGPDSLEKIDIDYLSSKLKRSKKPIKTVLLDQTLLAGIGNIYADEALFISKINPLRPANSLTLPEIKTLAKNIPAILKKSIAAGGTSSSDYVHLDGSKGSYLDIAWVYKREGEPCRVCQTPIKRIKIGGRSSHFCPNCQK